MPRGNDLAIPASREVIDLLYNGNILYPQGPTQTSLIPGTCVWVPGYVGLCIIIN